MSWRHRKLFLPASLNEQNSQSHERGDNSARSRLSIDVRLFHFRLKLNGQEFSMNGTARVCPCGQGN